MTHRERVFHLVPAASDLCIRFFFNAACALDEGGDGSAMAFKFSPPELATCSCDVYDFTDVCGVHARELSLDVVGMDSVYTTKMLFELVLMHAGLLDYAYVTSEKIGVTIEKMVAERTSRLNKKLSRVFTTNTDLIHFVLHHPFVVVSK
jgi:hypothetical protein